MNWLNFLKRKKSEETVESAINVDKESDGKEIVSEADRGLPSVNSKKHMSLMTRVMTGVLLIGVLVGIAVAISHVLPSEDTSKKKDKPQANTQDAAPTPTGDGLTLPDTPPLPASAPYGSSEPISEASAPAGATPNVPPIGVSPAASPSQSPAGAATAPQTQGQAPGAAQNERKVTTGLKYTTSGRSLLDAMGAPGSANANTQAPQVSQSSTGGSKPLDDMMNGSKTATAEAYKQINRNFLLPKGRSFKCVLEHAVDTTQPGMTSCLVSRDVYSANGRVLLIERGSEVAIEYQKGLNQGQDRVFLLPTTISTPLGVSVDLNSMVTDELGRAGITGNVNTHFWSRFGGAIMVGLIGDFGQALTQTSSSNNQVNFQNTTTAGSDAAAKAIENSVNIPPTLSRNQGAYINIYVTRNLDFRTVYAIRKTHR